MPFKALILGFLAASSFLTVGSFYEWNRYHHSVSCSERGSVVRQETTQINRSGSNVTRSSTSTYCR
jgi:hypothetical protein